MALFVAVMAQIDCGVGSFDAGVDVAMIGSFPEDIFVFVVNQFDQR